MLKEFRNWLAFITAYFVMAFFHETIHALIGFIFNEYNNFIIHPYGFEVVFKTSPENRSGFSWFLISGMSNIFTIAMGYYLYLSHYKVNKIKSSFLKSFLFYFTILLLLADPFNISIGPFIYGGDAIGIAKGLTINVLYVQIVGGVLLIINRELCAKYLLKFGIRTERFLLKPWFLPP